jgi:hypothetical protein
MEEWSFHSLQTIPITREIDVDKFLCMYCIYNLFTRKILLSIILYLGPNSPNTCYHWISSVFQQFVAWWKITHSQIRFLWTSHSVCFSFLTIRPLPERSQRERAGQSDQTAKRLDEEYRCCEWRSLWPLCTRKSIIALTRVSFASLAMLQLQLQLQLGVGPVGPLTLALALVWEWALPWWPKPKR